MTVDQLTDQQAFDYPLSRDQCTTLLAISDRTLSRYCSALQISAKEFSKESFAKLAHYAHYLKQGYTGDQAIQLMNNGSNSDSMEQLTEQLMLARLENEVEKLLPRFPQLVNIAIDRVITRQFALFAQSYMTTYQLLPGEIKQ